jgi:hypothetical protein
MGFLFKPRPLVRSYALVIKIFSGQTADLNIRTLLRKIASN